ncbi:DUF1702 family protein [Candidatus Parabeggiatoa sp. HSG14]|uniref:DUF1702 family protein n=1 Tax=Candidatus Parabeggiatoa sp. HSG14 TaxID=3055593 RepID=UPI0025A88CBC|nr:DUF1702 family protein [Thiotrichales bacterium HSG14]
MKTYNETVPLFVQENVWNKVNPYLFRKFIFGISPDKMQFSKRGFQAVSSEVRIRLEGIGEAFVCGYNAALLENDFYLLSQQLDAIPNESRGFAYGGAAMALTILDFLSPWHQCRLNQFVQEMGARHIYMIYLGVGWAWARLHRKIKKRLTNLDPLLGWLAVDGYGFHEGYFHWQKTINECIIPRHLFGYARCVFDQGVGRSLWFVKGADVEAIAYVIKGFSPERQADLWSGIGFAAAYVGGVEKAALNYLARESKKFKPQLAQGAAFAAKTRNHAGNLTTHTIQACQIFCASDAIEAARMTDEALIVLEVAHSIRKTPKDFANKASKPAYQVWQQCIQNHYREVFRSLTNN